MKYDQKESGKRIYLARQKKNVTQEQLALALNIHINTIGRIERGESGLSIDLLVELCNYLGVTLDYIILGREDEMNDLKQQLLEMGKKLIELSTIS